MLTDTHLATVQRTRPIREQRPWQAIHDPSGDFLGSHFRGTDLQVFDVAYWPEGIVFRNRQTRDYKIWKGTRFVHVKAFFLDLDGIRAGRYGVKHDF